MKDIVAAEHLENILEVSSDALCYLVGRGMAEGKIKVLRVNGRNVGVDWESAAAYLRECPEFAKVTSATEDSVLKLKEVYEKTQMLH